jgi:hypothetical protein
MIRLEYSQVFRSRPLITRQQSVAVLPLLPAAIVVTGILRYQLDPFKRALFEEYARRWLAIIPKYGPMMTKQNQSIDQDQLRGHLLSGEQGRPAAG